MVEVGTPQTDQSNGRLPQAELDRKAQEAARNPLGLTPLFNPDMNFSAMRNIFDPKAMANMQPGMQGIMTMIGPLLTSLFSAFMPAGGAAPGTTTPAGPNANLQNTQSPFVMAQNFAPRGPGANV